MTPAVPRRIRYHYSRPGRSITVYDEWLVVDRADVKVLLLEHHDGKSFVVAGETVMDRGAPIVWFIFPGAWYDVGRFHRSDGTFTGWYTNLTAPANVAHQTDWHCTDLFLDLWTPATGSSQWLDELEFDEAVSGGVLDRAQAEQVRRERTRIAQEVASGAWPPGIAREIGLAEVKQLLA